MIRRPPRSTPLYSSAASDVYKRQDQEAGGDHQAGPDPEEPGAPCEPIDGPERGVVRVVSVRRVLVGTLAVGGTVRRVAGVDAVDLVVGVGGLDHADPRAAGATRRSLSLSPVSYTHLRAHETDSYLVCR